MKVTRTKTSTGLLVQFHQPADHRPAPRFAKDHPLALALVAAGAAVAGPRRLVRWAGVVLPLLMQLRSGR